MFSVPPAIITLGVAALDRLGGQHHRFEAGTADLVDRGRAHGRGKTGADGGLAGHVLAQAGAEHVAEDHFVDLIGRNVGPSDGGLDGRAAQGGCRDLGKLLRKNCPRVFARRRRETLHGSYLRSFVRGRNIIE